MKTVKIIAALIICIIFLMNDSAEAQYTISLSSTVNFSSVILDGDDQWAYARMPNVEISTRNRNLNGNWHVDVTSTQLTNRDNPYTSYSLPDYPVFNNTSGSLQGSFDYNNPQWQDSIYFFVEPGPLTLDMSHRRLLYHTDVGHTTPIHRYRYMPSDPQGIRIRVPADALVGRYRGTLTVTLYNGLF